MALSKEQLKGRIRNVAKENNADARILMRIYMMERFLERVSHSKYADSFIIKGGILVTSIVGVSMRSTMDVDTTVKSLPFQCYLGGWGEYGCEASQHDFDMF